MEQEDKLLTTDEAASYLRKHPVYLRRLRSEGRGPNYLKPTPGTVRYRKSDIDSWLDSKIVQPMNN